MATASRPPLRRAALLFGGLLLIAMAMVYQPRTGWNVNSRLDLVFAVANDRTFAIDRWHERPLTETWDKAAYGGHYYSDKIFGVSLVALPVAWLLGLDGSPAQYVRANYLLRLWAVSVPAAIGVALLFALLARSGLPPRRALAAAALTFLGTLWFGYSTVFYPYALGIACVLGALWLVLFPGTGRLTPSGAAAHGFLLGYALLSDLIFGLAALGVGALLVLRLGVQAGWIAAPSFTVRSGPLASPGEVLGLAAVAAVAGAAPLALFAAYCHHLFGTFTIPYRFEVLDEFRAGMAAGFMGITRPRLDVLHFLTFHPFRGLFLYSPLLLVAAAGCVRGLRQRDERRLVGALGLSMAVAYLLFNSAYYMWWGGIAMGPRLLLPMVPLLALGFAGLGSGRFAWGALLAAGAVSVALSLPLSLTDPQLPSRDGEEAVAASRWGAEPAGLQGEALRAFYGLRVTSDLDDRMQGRRVGTGDRRRALLSNLQILAALGLSVAGGMWLLPPGTASRPS